MEYSYAAPNAVLHFPIIIYHKQEHIKLCSLHLASAAHIYQQEADTRCELALARPWSNNTPNSQLLRSDDDSVEPEFQQDGTH